MLLNAELTTHFKKQKIQHFYNHHITTIKLNSYKILIIHAFIPRAMR